MAGGDAFGVGAADLRARRERGGGPGSLGPGRLAWARRFRPWMRLAPSAGFWARDAVESLAVFCITSDGDRRQARYRDPCPRISRRGRVWGLLLLTRVRHFRPAIVILAPPFPAVAAFGAGVCRGGLQPAAGRHADGQHEQLALRERGAGQGPARADGAAQGRVAGVARGVRLQRVGPGRAGLRSGASPCVRVCGRARAMHGCVRACVRVRASVRVYGRVCERGKERVERQPGSQAAREGVGGRE